ncbi:hypothetical protein MUK42_35936 [Musa troglodytarum]|uniref:Expansin-like EG45 domain-containing protein n=1 Tax=Musa troglodytarum TaxID=320322 RepID=A0A9E7JYD4_9LILI|nr:hypothetical protein MUK42_35936 [Musa troglodytarum]
MALFTEILLFCLPSLLFQSPARAANACSACFAESTPAYSPNSDKQGTEAGACNYGAFRETLNGANASAASNLYRNGVVAVRCTDANRCSNDGVAVAIADSEASGGAEFILSQHACLRQDGSDCWCRVSCSHPNKNITFKIDQSSDCPSYLAFQTENLTYKLLERSNGEVWAVVSPPRGPLSVRMLLSGGDEDETWLVPPHDIDLDCWSNL